jgi:hypothetical protein
MHCTRSEGKAPFDILARDAVATGLLVGCGQRQAPILPPPVRVMATTEGRGGMAALKSGHRVNGLL